MELMGLLNVGGMALIWIGHMYDAGAERMEFWL